MMGTLVLALLFQTEPTPVQPVLAFPEPGMDDSAAYQGYQTRFYRDSKGNTVQIYLEPKGGRAVLVWADALDESAGFTARDPAGRPARLGWDSVPAEVADSGAARAIEYRLDAGASAVELGWFLLGSMRVERDFVYQKKHLLPFRDPPFVVREESLLVADVARLPAPQRKEHLAQLGAGSVAALRARLLPVLAVRRTGDCWTVSVRRPSLDGRNRMALELRGDIRESTVRTNGRTVRIAARRGGPVRFAVRVTTDGAPLTPLRREEIFNSAFLAFLARTGRASDSAGVMRYRRLEREVRGVELLGSREKLMAGLPNFATYFGRDMMMTALMMRPVWRPEMSEHVIASVLRKLGPRGDVSHEEALGGQAIRENAAVYDSLVTAALGAGLVGRPTLRDTLFARAREVLRGLQVTRENYHMVDDEFQLPGVAARYLADSAVPAARKRAFLLEAPAGGASRLSLLLRELALVAAWTRPYAAEPLAVNLVSFPRRDSSHWRSASWRDSDAGYAGGRFAMDINAIWAPQALSAMGAIVGALPGLGLGPAELDSVALRHALETWRGARRHFVVALGPAEVEARVAGRLARLPEGEAAYWRRILAQDGAGRDSLHFLALSLDEEGRPIPVVNTDPATDLFLSDSLTRDEALLDLAPFVRPYPVGLFVTGLGPLVANDAYASPAVWERFESDAYHSPRVVWGREVNLLFLGLASRIAADPAGTGPFRDALRQTFAAVDASGLRHNELWSYHIEEGRLYPIRYGTSSDVQLWNATDLAVQFVLAQLEGDP